VKQEQGNIWGFGFLIFSGQQIMLDLDDGVKINHGKSGDLLADARAVRGETGPDE
jgi:hypothetical protein